MFLSKDELSQQLNTMTITTLWLYCWSEDKNIIFYRLRHLKMLYLLDICVVFIFIHSIFTPRRSSLSNVHCRMGKNYGNLIAFVKMQIQQLLLMNVYIGQFIYTNFIGDGCW